MNHTNRPEKPTLAATGELSPRHSFWQTRTAQDALPFATSVIFHLMVIVLGILLVPKIVNNLTPDHSRPQLVPASSPLDLDDSIDGVKVPGVADNPLRPLTPANDPSERNLSGRVGHSISSIEILPGSSGDRDMRISHGPSSVPGNGDPFDSGTGNKRTFTHPSGQGPMFPHPPSAPINSVVFVCDATGSMLERGKIDILKSELKREISHMVAIQSFNIIFFQETEDRAGFKAYRSKLVPANAGNQSAVETFLEDVNAHGPTVPIGALDEAYKESPQTIFFLTDGEFDNPQGPNNDQMLAYFAKAGAAHKVHVNTVLFLRDHQDTKDALVTPTLEKIAHDNGGTFKTVYADSLE